MNDYYNQQRKIFKWNKINQLINYESLFIHLNNKKILLNN
jgi:hypothetical protein